MSTSHARRNWGVFKKESVFCPSLLWSYLPLSTAFALVFQVQTSPHSAVPSLYLSLLRMADSSHWKMLHLFINCVFRSLSSSPPSIITEKQKSFGPGGCVRLPAGGGADVGASPASTKGHTLLLSVTGLIAWLLFEMLAETPAAARVATLTRAKDAARTLPRNRPQLEGKSNPCCRVSSTDVRLLSELPLGELNNASLSR
mmetsp:Transcript_88117/g.174875  ORF Transcript_88117/g.174875 Transcript_88117/m.174875 type:complete len:200 (+) Transcript_88117:505-1104(+)